MAHRCQSVLLALSVLVCPLVCRGGLDCCHAEVAEVSPCCSACDGGHGGAAGDRDSVPDDDSAPQAGGDCICAGAVVEVSLLHDLVADGWSWLPLESASDSIAAVFDFSRPGIARLPLPDDDMNTGRALRCLLMSYLCRSAAPFFSPRVLLRVCDFLASAAVIHSVGALMFMRLLPWEYATRNLFRRPLRTFLTFVGLATVVFLVFVVVGFIRGLERSLAVSGERNTAVVFGLGMGENLEYSSIDMSVGDILAASVEGIHERYGQKYVSPELYLGTEMGVESTDQPLMGLARGVTRSALLVRQKVELEEGRWPRSGEVLVGRLAATKLAARAEDLAIGKKLRFEGREWRISGTFSAAGAAFESEVWCPLDDLQQAMKRQDLSLVAVTMAPRQDFANLELFCVERLDLELQMMPEVAYYAALQRDYRPVRLLAWLVVLLVTGAGVFAGLNTMYGSVVGRVRELAALQTMGFARRALVISLIQEGVILAAAASLLATAAALVFVNNAAVRFTMGAFSLRIDEVALLVGGGVGVLLGVLGAVPPALRALGMPIVEALKAT